ncbi:MAG: polysulfide reductase NrfD [Acidisphaera sp.]|nr:polysulfide reductase NrfD [Acidisphaera sp.]
MSYPGKVEAVSGPLEHSTRQRAPYGRTGDRSPFRQVYDGPTYYGRNTVKPSPFDWKIALYIFLGGLSGAAEIIATVADFDGNPALEDTVRQGRYLALVGTLAGPPLLIAGLHTPSRWYNMLRIFRGTSPMSIGSWILTAFGGFAVATAAAQGGLDTTNPVRWPRLRRILRGSARVLQVPAALAGAGMSVYTAGLMAATSTPLWAAAPRLLAARFAAAAMAAASAALSLGARRHHRIAAAERLEDLTALAAATELVMARASNEVYRQRGVDTALHEPQFRLFYSGGAELIGTAVPLALYVANRVTRHPSNRLAWAGGLAVMAGSAALRLSMMYAGNESARHPEPYLAATQSERTSP